MIISHSHKFIFIKSVKTAGTSVEAALSRHCVEDDVVTPLGDYKVNRDDSGNFIHLARNAYGFEQHADARSIRNGVAAKVWADYFKFTIVRNPWDRAVSLFHWKTRHSPPPGKRFYHYLGVGFDEFEETKKRFSEFLRGEWNTNDRFYVIDGELCVDFVIRYEHLVGDLGIVCARVGFPGVSLPKLKSGIRSEIRHYSEYYDEHTRAIVETRHENDLRLFGYRFERKPEPAGK